MGSDAKTAATRPSPAHRGIALDGAIAHAELAADLDRPWGLLGTFGKALLVVEQEHERIDSAMSCSGPVMSNRDLRAGSSSSRHTL